MDTLNMDTFAKIAVYSLPIAIATVRGSDFADKMSGTVRFYRAGKGTLIVTEMFRLPTEIAVNGKTEKAGPFYAFHVHEGTACGSGAGDTPFAESGGHLNPLKQPHPLHMGDMPPILSDNGYGFLAFYTSRFSPEDVIGRTVIIHQNTDDFHTQPSGNAGRKIACGEIKATSSRL